MDTNYILGLRQSGEPIALTADERRRHIEIIGKTGTGKSSLLYNLMRADFAAGRGFAFIDPHGDQAAAIVDATSTYTNTAAAERALRDNGREIRQKPNLSNSFFHDLMACALGAAFELSARTDPEIAYLSWEDIRDHELTPEKTRRAPAPFNIPLRRGDLRPDDRPFGLRYTRPDGRKRTLVFAGFEADRSTEPLRPTQLRHSSMTQKFADYREFIDREIYAAHFGFPMVPLIPIVTVSEARMRNMMMLLTEICGASMTKYFLFRAMPAFASFEQSIPVIDDLLTSPWQRVGAEPMHIVDVLKRA